MNHPTNNPQRFPAFRSGSPGAFREYYDLHFDEVLFHILRQTDNEALAEDLCIEAFCILDRNRDAINDEEHILGFLIVAAHNLVYAHFRKQVRERKMKIELSWLMSGLADAPNAGEGVSAEVLADLRKSFLGLPARKRRIIALRYCHNYPTNLIAARLGITRQTVLNHLSQSIEKFREDLFARWGQNNPLFS